MGLILPGLLADVQAGGYVSAIKVLPVLIVLMIWARLLTWIDKDSENARLPRIPLNTGFQGGLVVGFFLFILLPNFIVALLVLIGVMVVEIGVYLMLRKQKVGLGDLGDEFKNWLR